MKLAATSVGRPGSACLRDFRKVGNRGQERIFAWKNHWTWILSACRLDRTGSHETIRVGETVSQFNGDSVMVTVYWLCGDRVQQRNNGLCQHYCLGENWLSSPGPEAKQFSSFLYVPGAFWAALEFRMRESALSQTVDHLKEIPGTLEATISQSHLATILPFFFPHSQKLWELVF